ncbi:MAG: single-stranded DNA-binding protein [Aliivibrio sp.]|nr:single-stranded DNA-binding protein [Aliivibrio sp.]MCP4323331.1 single-stranded DNA-binding protein [Alteromonadales bacterium]
MQKSESIKAIASALNKAQNEMSGAHKAKDNPFFKSKYADLAEVVKAVKEPFANNGLSYVQFPIEKDGRIGIETILMHESGEFMSNEFTVQLTKQDAQGAGSAITYCRRYALQSVAGIPSEDDDGNAASPQPNQKQDDDKPWYDDSNWEVDKQGVTNAIKGGTPPEQVIKQIAGSFKIAKKYREMIKAI